MNKSIPQLLRRAAIAAVALLATSATASATSLFIHAAGAADRSVELGEIAQISFSTEAVTVSLTNGTDITVPASEFTSISTTGQESGSATIAVDASQGAFDVYNLAGVKVATLGADGLSTLSSGVYLLNNQSGTIKIVVP